MWQLNRHKSGLRSGTTSANEAKQLRSDRTPDKKQNKREKLKKNMYSNVRDMLEGGENTSPQEVGICATVTSQ